MIYKRICTTFSRSWKPSRELSSQKFYWSICLAIPSRAAFCTAWLFRKCSRFLASTKYSSTQRPNSYTVQILSSCDAFARTQFLPRSEQSANKWDSWPGNRPEPVPKSLDLYEKTEKFATTHADFKQHFISQFGKRWQISGGRNVIFGILLFWKLE